MDICMIGTGYVGLVTGTCLAEIGNHVVCTDIDEKKIELLNRGEVPIYEPGLEELVKKNVDRKMLEFTCDIQKAIGNSSIIFIAVGTPPKKDGGANLSYVFQAAKSIAAALNEYKIVVDKSTVPVGTAAKVREIIEKNKKDNTSFTVVSNPEFLREGSALKDIFEENRVVIGVDDKRAEKIMSDLYQPFGLPIFITDVISAEMIKYASNAFLATKISFINEIANICEKVDADVKNVAQGMGFDKRIGKGFLDAGLGYGGSCFPKDVSALAMTAKENDYNFRILNAVMEVNENQKELMVKKVFTKLKRIKNPVVGILGLAFKPSTDDVREAPSLYIINRLKQKGIQIKAYDPVAIDNAKKIISDICYCTDLYQACENVDALLIVTEWEEFKKMDLNKIKDVVKTPLIIDGRNIFEPKDMKIKGFNYVSIGRK